MSKQLEDYERLYNWLVAKGSHYNYLDYDDFYVKSKDVESKLLELAQQLEQANERIKELEEQLCPTMFWNEDGDMSFDSLDELADYYLDSYEKGGQTVCCQQAVKLPDAEYSFKYDADKNEWVVTELNKESNQ